MEELTDFIKKMSVDRDLTVFIHKNEIWLSGYKDGLKLDIFIKLFRDGKIKLVYELPQERKVALFLSKDNLISRLKELLNYEVV
ncbi:MAG: hypothetical protein N2Z80_05430 [Hydrogenothermaceae bacterium]|nr:hypothetical protein [Hydrogenothermaceae bacterium]